ncbi:hypothetical protein SAMN06265379_104120 [Saccharicrinis carchari]|uniref:Uncharacterized protein n=1 Tax=Saccharicrinis carchari TaxID=1168039 RepID=A0A521D1L5_SACCC|nr:hypothetical protein [Saccharicrinis carchari]SMO65576.1 hypothetical protein SAMN06265379_104120 [Saccharicrinis carchari]
MKWRLNVLLIRYKNNASDVQIGMLLIRVVGDEVREWRLNDQ